MNTLLLKQLQALLDEEDETAALLNGLSFLFYEIPDISWIGIYRYAGGELVLNLFAGKPACTHIALGKGVCGTSFEKKESLVVENVCNFPGHIACDPLSRSEIVIPFESGYGVLDIDSPIVGRLNQDALPLFMEIARYIDRRIKK